MTPIYTPLLGIMDSGKSGNLITTNFISIATATVDSGGSSTINFSSIPSTYTHLQLRYVSKIGSSSDNVIIKFNGDTASNYSWHYLMGNGSSASAGSGASQGYILNDVLLTQFNGSIVDILDYTNTAKAKTTRTLMGVDMNGSGNVWLSSGAWYNNTAGVYPAINSITLTTNGTFQQYSQFALYGVK